MDRVIIGAMQTPDGYWRVEVFHERGRREQWYRVLHAQTVVAEKAALATVQRILGEDAFSELVPVEAA